MRLTGLRLPLLAAVASASVGLFVWATDRTYGDTLVVLPRTSTISVSRPYVIPTCVRRTVELSDSQLRRNIVQRITYGEPMAHRLYRNHLQAWSFRPAWIVERPVIAAYPTTYVPTTYISSYVPTTYISPYVPTTYVSSYVPTTYVSPTYYSTAYRVRRYRPTTYTYYPRSTKPLIQARRISAAIRSWWTRRSAPCRNPAERSRVSPGLEVESGSFEGDTIDSNVTTPLPEDMARQRSTVRGDGANGAQTGRRQPAHSTRCRCGGGQRSDRHPGTQKNAPTEKAGEAPASKKTTLPAAPADDSQDLRPALGMTERSGAIR